MAGRDDQLIAAVRAALHAGADPHRAVTAQAYMKSALPYLGVRVSQVRALVRAALRTRPIADPATLRATVVALWDGAQYREERYAATELLSAPATRGLRTPALIDLYERLIVDGAWWDHVDELAHRVGELLVRDPELIAPTVRSWQRSPDRWLRRVSIICQVGAKDATDPVLLTEAIEANAADRDFFLRKAIGWALRDYARTRPDWVRAFVADHELSPLSVREASKHL